MSLEQWMEQLSEDDGFDPVLPDEDGTYRFLCDAVEVAVRSPEDGTVVLEAALGALPAELSGRLALAALQANHLFDQTGGAVFCRNPGTGRLLLRLPPAHVETADDLEALLERFVAQAERWQALFARYAELQAGTQGSEHLRQEHETMPAPGNPGTWLAV